MKAFFELSRKDYTSLRAEWHETLKRRRNLWRLGRFDKAEDVFNRMLQLNPVDNPGARILLPAIQSPERWEAFQK